MKILVGESQIGQSTVMSLVSAPYTTGYTAEELYKQSQERPTTLDGVFESEEDNEPE